MGTTNNNTEIIKLGAKSNGYGLGGSHGSCVAVRNCDSVLCLVGETTAYSPIGGRKVLKEIIETTIEGVTYYFKTI